MVAITMAYSRELRCEASGMSTGDTISIRNSLLRWDDSGIQELNNRIASTDRTLPVGKYGDQDQVSVTDLGPHAISEDHGHMK